MRKTRFTCSSGRTTPKLRNRRTSVEITTRGSDLAGVHFGVSLQEA